MLLFLAGAAFDDVGASVFDVAVSLLVAGATFVMSQCHFSWPAHLVMLERHFSWQAHHLVMSECHFSWQAQYLVKSG